MYKHMMSFMSLRYINWPEHVRFAFMHTEFQSNPTTFFLSGIVVVAA